jgi:hypothetical protein
MLEGSTIIRRRSLVNWTSGDGKMMTLAFSTADQCRDFTDALIALNPQQPKPELSPEDVERDALDLYLSRLSHESEFSALTDTLEKAARISPALREALGVELNEDEEDDEKENDIVNE